MARPQRIVYPGAWYHVSSRGDGGTPVFMDGDSGRSFLAVLAEVAAAMGVEVHAYCLLVDGYDLLVRTPRANLPEAMRQLNGQYAHWCRRDARRGGPVFNRRYRSVLLDPDEWPLRLSRYIHLQPLQQRLVTDPLLYRWSSLRVYGGKAPGPDWLETEPLLRLVGGPEQYLAYVGYGVDAETRAFYARTRRAPTLGHPREHSAEPHGDGGSGIGIDDIVRCVAAAYDLQPDRLLEPRRGRGEQATPRAVTMLLARSPGGHSLEAIAEALRVQHRSTVSVTVRRCRERLRRDADLKARVEAISRSLTV